ncbi:MAG: serine/threonine-protein kinase, partial [Polyangiaceae bacterium]
MHPAASPPDVAPPEGACAGSPTVRAAPDALGKYRIIAELARGGMGVVRLALTQGLAGFTKLLVLKELRSEFLDDPAFVRMFFDEARLAARLNHPNVVQTIEVGSDGRRPFIAMEYIEGQSLQRVIRRARSRQRVGEASLIPLHVRMRALADVLSALDYAHGLTDIGGEPLGLVHRDVSPHNVLVTYEGHVKLVDFGIAKTESAREETRAGVLKGKTMYMAPEQAACENIDCRADVFSVGLMLWEAVAGRRAWEGMGDVAILRSLLVGSVPRIAEAKPDIDADLEAIVRRATSADPGERYPTARALRADIEGYLATHDELQARGRDLGATVSLLFAEDRRRLQAVIDHELRGLLLHEASTSDPPAGMSSIEPFVVATPVPSVSVDTPSARGFSPPPVLF